MVYINTYQPVKFWNYIAWGDVTTCNITYYLPHTKILAIRLVKTQSRAKRYFSQHVNISSPQSIYGKWRHPWDSIRGIVPFVGKNQRDHDKLENLHGHSGRYCHALPQLPRWRGREHFQFPLTPRNLSPIENAHYTHNIQTKVHNELKLN